MSTVERVVFADSCTSNPMAVDQIELNSAQRLLLRLPFSIWFNFSGSFLLFILFQSLLFAQVSPNIAADGSEDTLSSPFPIESVGKLEKTWVLVVDVVCKLKERDSKTKRAMKMV